MAWRHVRRSSFNDHLRVQSKVTREVCRRGQRWEFNPTVDIWMEVDGWALKPMHFVGRHERQRRTTVRQPWPPTAQELDHPSSEAVA
jgi:hypothetical protein